MSELFSLRLVLIAFVVLIAQIFVPVIKFYGLEVIPDILIIFVAYIGYYYGRFEAIIIGFIFGLIQDFITQVELFGIMAFTKSLIGYGLGTMALYRYVWSKYFRMFFILVIYFLHFFIYYYIKFNGSHVSISLLLQITVIHSIMCFVILWVFDRAIMKNGVLR